MHTFIVVNGEPIFSSQSFSKMTFLFALVNSEGEDL